MKENNTKRFQDLFAESGYVYLKNYLYNYRLRKMAVEKSFRGEKPRMILEAGSGISPVMTRSDRIVFMDLSFGALNILRRSHGRGGYVVADAMHLPFKPGVYSHAVCSEVLEHLEDDREVLKELARVMAPSGRLTITFPHRKFYFARDDRFVNHLRRYELPEMKTRLLAAGFRPLHIQKVLGPLDKLTMCLAVFCFALIQRNKDRARRRFLNPGFMKLLAFLFNWTNFFYMSLAWLDAVMVPRAFAAILLMHATLGDHPPPKD